MKRFLSFLALLALTPVVFAAPNFFTPATNDQSLYMLSTIFGNVGSILDLAPVTASTNLMTAVFYYFNQTVIVLGIIVIAYTLIVSLINTSHSGEALGSKWHSIWIPMRSAIGFALLLPIGSGKTYAVAQAIVMWVIVQGVGAADYLWSNMVNQIVSGGAVVTADTASSATASDTIMAAFQDYVCAMEYVQMQGYEKFSTQSRNTPPTYPNKNAYLKTVPRLSFQTSDSGATQPNTNFWTFGVANPNSWSMSSICGTITMPASNSPGAQNNPALANYYDNQRNILAMALGMVNDTNGAPTRTNLSNTVNNGADTYPLYLPNSDNQQGGDYQYQIQGSVPTNPAVPQQNPPVNIYYSGGDGWGIYGGNWLGDYTGGGTLGGQSAGLSYMWPEVNNGQVTYTRIQLPTVAYLAELLAENIDNNSPAPNPTLPSGTTTNQGPGGNGITTFPTNNTILYVEGELALIAQAYSQATAANYNAYQSALAAQTAAQNGTAPPSTSGGTTQALAAAAKFNGWGSAGAFYLDMAKVLQSSTSDIAAVKTYNYAALACSNGVGVSIEASDNNTICNDARSPSDVGGQYNNKHKNNKKAQIGSYLGNSITQAQNVTMQAQGIMTTIGDYTPGRQKQQSKNQTPCEQKSIAQGHNGSYVTYTSGDKTYKENCGIVNTTQGGAFGVGNKPQFPKMVMNPLAWYNYVDQMLVYNFSLAIQPLAQMGQNAVMPNPVLTLRKTGMRLLNTSATLFHVGENYMWYSGLISMFATNWSPLPGAAMSTFTWMASMATAMIAAMMAMGAILAYYIPMVPYLVFTFAFIQWLVLTIEAMTAAPLMALGILHPEGQHEVFGHASMGIATLATVFLRPSLMIVGYFAATVMCTVVVLVLNAGFFFAANSMITGDTSTGSLFGCVIVWMMYINTVIVGVTKSFSLIYHIPDHVTRWIGINEPSSDVEQMLSQVKEGVKQGGELGEQGMSSKAEAKAGTAAKTFSD